MERAYGFSNLVFWYARIPQIVANARARSTGALSGLSTLMQAAGGAGACPVDACACAVPLCAPSFSARTDVRVRHALRSAPAAPVRILTTVQEGGGRAMLAGYVVGLLLNFVLLAQIVIFRDAAGADAGAGRRGRGPVGPPRRRSKQA